MKIIVGGLVSLLVGTTLATGPARANFPVGVVVQPNGVPIVADDSLVARVDPLSRDASPIADAGDGLTGCCGLVRAPEGTLFMAHLDDGVPGVDGADTIKGKGGRDVICGGAGRDEINGGPGWG